MAAAGGLVILMSSRDSHYQPFHRQYVHPASDSTFFSRRLRVVAVVMAGRQPCWCRHHRVRSAVNTEYNVVALMLNASRSRDQWPTATAMTHIRHNLQCNHSTKVFWAFSNQILYASFQRLQGGPKRHHFCTP